MKAKFIYEEYNDLKNKQQIIQQILSEVHEDSRQEVLQMIMELSKEEFDDLAASLGYNKLGKYWTMADVYGVDEAQNFERGIEPAKSMNVGMSKRISELIENLLKYEQIEKSDRILEIRFYPDIVSFGCDSDDWDEKEAIIYIRDLIKQFGLDPFIILSPVKVFRPMGVIDFLFDLTELGKKVSPIKRFYILSGGEVESQNNDHTSFQALFGAKKLEEAYHFQRGRDPKRSIQIGQHWNKTKSQLSAEIVKRVEDECKSLVKAVSDLAIAKGYSSSSDYVFTAYPPEGGTKVDDEIEEAIKLVEDKVSEIMEEYPFDTSKDDLALNELVNFMVVGEPPYGTLRTEIEAVLDNSLKESRFERGIDPKESMNIGQKGMKQKLLDMRYPALKNSSVWKKDWEDLDALFNFPGVKVHFVGDKVKVIIPKKVPLHLRTSLFQLPIMINFEKERIKKFVTTQDRDAEGNTYETFKILESANFERGLNPKEMMDIGRDRSDAPDEQIFLRMHEEASKSPNFQYVTDINWKNEEPVFTIKSKKIITVKRTFRDYENEFREGYVNEPELFTIYLTKDQGVTMFNDLTNDEYENLTFKEFLKITNCRSIKESVNFERGKDVKKSMDIGLQHKYGRMYNLFTICHNLSMNSDSFEWVSDIVWNPDDADHPYFNIDSFYYYTDEDENNITEKFVVRLFPNYLEIYNVITEEEEEVRSVRKFIEITSAYEEDTARELGEYLKDF
ncbi:MAG TPA: hypothetical protein PKK55_03430 [Methanofastidiosum sp.]|nr:hypothetical protein [Methanofastidiosum sp.]HOG74274.1 hypothetical protein [Methanofastidiosum sp.]